MINFSVTDEEKAIINKIVERATKGSDRDPIDIAMDITACHANGWPLRLQDLLEADDFNFTHDVVGIARHIDRRTGRLTGYFSPRFAK